MSGRGVSTNFIGKAGEPLFDDAPFIAAFGLQFDTPAGYAGRDPFPAAAPTDATGWTGALPNTYSPRQGDAPAGARLGTVDKYGLNAWIFDSTNDGKTNYDKVLFSRTKSAADAVATIGKGVFADVKVKIQGGALDGKTAGMLVRVEELTPDLSRVRLFHTSVSRAIATWPTWPGEPGFTGDFAEYLAQTFPTSTAADFAILEAGVTSEDTYVDQGLYWATGHQPMLKYVMSTYHPDLLLAGVPTTDEFQHQFLGLVSPRLPNGAPNPAFDDVDLNGVPDGRVVRQRERYIREAYMEADETLTLARRLAGGDPVTFVSSDHGFAPQFLAVDASKPLVDLGLLSKPQTSNCRRRVGRDHRLGQGLLGRWRRPDLPQRGRARSDQRGSGSAVQADRGEGRRRDRRQDHRGLPGPRRTPTTGPTTASPKAGRSSTASSPRRRRGTSRTGPAARPTWRIRPARATSSRSPSRPTSSTPRRRAR